MTDAIKAKFQDLATQKKIYGTKKSACRFSEVMNELPSDSAEYLQQIIDTPEGIPGRLSNATIALVLQSEGYAIGRTSVGEHRRKYCQCYIGGEN